MASSHHGGHPEHHKKGSFFTRLFKNKRESQTDVHNHDHSKDKVEDKDHKDKKNTITKSPSETNVQQTTEIAKKEIDTAHANTHPNNNKHEEPTETKSTSRKELPPIPTTATTEATENKPTTVENKVNEPTITHNKTAETDIQQTTIKNNIPDSIPKTLNHNINNNNSNNNNNNNHHNHNHNHNHHNHNNHHHPNPPVNGSDDSSGTNGTHTYDKTQSDRSSACYTDRSYTDNDNHNHNNNNNNNNNDSHNHQAHGVAAYTPLPFYEGSPKNMHPTSQPQKPRASGPPEILPEEIEYDTTADFLGQGSFGSVYKGRCRGQEVAVKIPRKQKLSLSELTSFRNEVKIMSKIYHPNVVLFLGACTQMGKMQIVTERCTTDLEKLLASKRPLSLYERMRMAKDAALGMNWLHGITRIVHNDLKSANLLVDNHMRVKVTDFGFSSIKEGDQFVDKAKKGTPLWMAPEVMMGQPYDDKADVYSFGIILWEIVTRDVPYKHHTDYNTFSRAVCHDHERPPLPADIMPSLKYLITNCWDHDPKIRPSFNELVFRISEVMVECMIENENARQLWKKYFLLPKQELFEQISWPDFAACIGQNLGLKNANDSADYLANVKRLLITLPQNTMGLVNEVVTMDRLDKTIKWFGKFFDPVEGPTVMKEINSLAGESWFHWDISRDESTARLAGHEEGTFLLRLSSTDPRTTPFTLSLTGNQHRRIKRIPGGQYKLQGKHMIYSDLPSLVQLCSDYKLLKPCPKVDISNPYAIDNMT